jgi:aromatic-amino-acid transaminase
VLSQLQAIVRGIYSSPPLHGARLVATVLGDADLRAQWEGEVNAMRQRIQRVRGALQTRLAEALPDVSFDHLGMQRGMFSYTGLSPALVDALRTEKSVYLLRSGRACMAGLNDTNIDWVAKAIGEVVRKQTRAAVTSGAASQRRTG